MHHHIRKCNTIYTTINCSICWTFGRDNANINYAQKPFDNNVVDGVSYSHPNLLDNPYYRVFDGVLEYRWLLRQILPHKIHFQFTHRHTFNCIQFMIRIHESYILLPPKHKHWMDIVFLYLQFLKCLTILYFMIYAISS